jgi:hypothetical protein
MTADQRLRIPERSTLHIRGGSQSSRVRISTPVTVPMRLIIAQRPYARKARMALLCALACAAGGCASSVPAPESLVGDWQFPRTSAWIRIAPDGRTFQCRQGRSGALFRAVGRLRGSTITWSQEWEADTVVRRGDAIVLTGPYGSFTFGKPVDPLPGVCEAPF